ncbi:MAG: tellurite resistance/C4-dicarboxylate transporter family protein [Chloroflexi bacterium]|nr:tellurite resistance/C4-dicarboxylate transporter family protein [Chloroflexota bacterium]MBI3340648.1 tellurite resistance/C4-dicarboxylate transporter family protein [Chloroflexota bacterium]
MWNRITSMVQNGVRDLFPAYFALVMATGIVSIACYLLKMDFLAFPLFYLNQFFYIILWLLTIARIFQHPSRLIGDLSNHRLGTGFLTLVAGTNVLGSQFVILSSNQTVAFILWILGLALWLLLIYALFTILTVKEEKPPLESGINGAWMLFVVSTQSIVVLGMLIASRFSPWDEMFAYAMLGFYLLGCMFYILIISLIVYRFMFFKIGADEMGPPYWINMGAVAITTLAGANILLKGNAPFLNDLIPFIKGFTIFFWASGTWWIPLLFLLGAWRHIYKRYPLTYHPAYWGLVFPMGMYTVCTFRLAQVMKLDFLLVIPKFFIYLALIAWAATIFGLARQLITTFIKTEAVEQINKKITKDAGKI